MTRSLRDEPVLVLDCQATGASPAHGHLLELGWAVLGGADAPVSASSTLVALPEGAEIPAIVRALTGVAPEQLAGAPSAAVAWSQLCAAAPAGAPAVVHFARFEQSFLLPLHAQLQPQQPVPFELLCTHEIGRRLLPGMPRMACARSRATSVTARASCGAAARTCSRPRSCGEAPVAALAEHGVDTLAGLRAWLQTKPARASRRVYPMPRERRLQLPDRPGVYRMLRHGGDVLYVGKARSLRRRVNTYFQKQHGIPERTLQLLSQARDLDVTAVATPLEAALLEADEIKRLDPPFNVALKASGRAPWFADVGLTEVVAEADATHREGPLGSAWSLRRIAALREGVAAAGDAERLAARGQALRLALGRPDAALLDDATPTAGVDAFVQRSGVAAIDRAALLRVGAQLWRAHRAAAAASRARDDDDDDDELDDADAREDAPAPIERRVDRRRRRRGPGRVRARAGPCGAARGAAAHARRRPRRLRRRGAARTLVLEAGVVAAACDGTGGPSRLPTRATAEALDPAAYDRLRARDRAAARARPRRPRWSAASARGRWRARGSAARSSGSEPSGRKLRFFLAAPVKRSRARRSGVGEVFLQHAVEPVGLPAQ
ncbi:MAG: hypothetical protein U0168_32165 [Nannocystaceae bacterium]